MEADVVAQFERMTSGQRDPQDVEAEQSLAQLEAQVFAQLDSMTSSPSRNREATVQSSRTTPSTNRNKDCTDSIEPLGLSKNNPLSLDLPSMSLFSGGDFFAEIAESVASLGVHPLKEESNPHVSTKETGSSKVQGQPLEHPSDSLRIAPSSNTGGEKDIAPRHPDESRSAPARSKTTLTGSNPAEKLQDPTLHVNHTPPPDPPPPAKNMAVKRTHQRRVPLSPRRRYFSPVMEDRDEEEEEKEEHSSSRQPDRMAEVVNATILSLSNIDSQHRELHDQKAPANFVRNAPIVSTTIDSEATAEFISSDENSDKGTDDSSVKSERVAYGNTDEEGHGFDTFRRIPRPPSTVSMNSNQSLRNSASSIEQSYSKKRSVRFFDWMTSKLKTGSVGSGIGKLSLLESRLEEPTTDKRETYAELIRALRKEQTNLSLWTKKHVIAPSKQERYRKESVALPTRAASAASANVVQRRTCS